MSALQSLTTAVRTVLKTPLLLAIGLAFGLTESQGESPLLYSWDESDISFHHPSIAPLSLPR